MHGIQELVGHAARGGHLDVLQWVRDVTGHGVKGRVEKPLKPVIFIYSSGLYIEWLSFNNQEAHPYATSSGNLQVLEWIRQGNDKQ